MRILNWFDEEHEDGNNFFSRKLFDHVGGQVKKIAETFSSAEEELESLITPSYKRN